MSSAVAIGVDVGGTHIRAGRIDASGAVLSWSRQATAGSPRDAASQIAAMVRSIADPSVAAVGIGVPGRVDVKRGAILSGGYVDLAGVEFAAAIGDAVGCPVFVDNDGNMAMVAEHAVGAAKSCDTAILFTIGTGIGGAIIVGGRLFRGRAAAGQLGHVTVDRGGGPCLCGRRGCIETTSSGTALGRHIRAAGLADQVSVEMLLKRAKAGDMAAKAVIAEWAGPMRLAIDTIVAAFDPEIVVIGGGLGASMVEALEDHPAVTPWYRCPVVGAKLGERAGVIGAGLAALASLGEAGR